MRQVAKKGLLTVAAAGSVLAVTGGYAYADSGAQGAAAHSPGVASGNTVQVPVHVPVNVCGNTVNVVGALNPASGNTCVNGGHGGHGSHGGHASHGQGHGHGGGHHDGGHHGGGAGAEGAAVGSPGIASGNVVQAPVDVPVNACGNTVDVAAVANPTFGNACINGGHDHGRGPDHTRPHHPGEPSHHHPPADKPHGDHGTHEDHGTHGDKDKPCDEHRPAGHHNPPAEHSAHKPGHVTPGPVTSGPIVPVAVVKDAHRPAAQAAVEEKDDQLAHTGAGELGMAGAASAALLLGGAVLYRRSRAGQQG
ncbi:chaplin [Streptomyces mobaraensis]|uniref:chaplin n=1 Tax=Streptomyces mobaraensis TaxID=35621 RepID=UPI0033241E3E